MGSKKILLISHWAPPESGAGSARVEWITKCLNMRYSVTTIAPIKHEIKSTRQVKRLELFSGGTNIVKFITSIIGLYEFAKKDKYEVCIGSSPDIILPFQLALVAKLLKIPYILDARDIQSLILQRITPGVKSNIIKIFEKFTLKMASSVIVTNEMQLKRTINSFHISSNKFTIIPNGIDIETHKLIKQSKIYDIAFYGSINPERDPTRLMKLIMVLPKDLVIGFIGTSLEQLERIFTPAQFKFLLNRVKIIPPLDHKRAFAQLQKAKVGIITIADINEIDYQMPVKIFSYMAAGIPVICLGYNSKNYVNIFMKKNNIGFYETSIKEFAKSLEKILTDQKLYMMLSSKNKRLAKSFDRNNYSELLFEVVKNGYQSKD